MYVRIEKIKTFYRIPLLFNEKFVHITNNGRYNVCTHDGQNSLQ